MIPADNPADTRRRPQSLADLFFSFTILALQGFGGVLAVVQRELVERKGWLTQEEFTEELAVAQIMPGPNVVNLSLVIGARYFGMPGAAAALAGMLAIPLLLIIALALVHSQFADHPGVAGAPGMAAVSAGMIAATGVKLATSLKRHPLPLALGLGVSVLAVVLLVWLRIPLLYVLGGLGGLCCLLTYRKLNK
jgi:chromate transporter